LPQISAETILPYMENDWLKWSCRVTNVMSVQSDMLGLVCNKDEWTVKFFSPSPVLSRKIFENH